MKMKWIYLAYLVAAITVLLALSAHAQKQTDIAASIDGNFTQSSASGVDVQTPSNSIGGLLEVRHIINSWIGFEATYSYNSANQVYGYSILIPVRCPALATCYQSGVSVSAYAQTITGDWVMSKRMGKFRPFVVAGGGVLRTLPDGEQPSHPNINNMPAGTAFVFQVPSINSGEDESVFVFGTGLDWRVSSHLGLRLQYREYIYKSPLLVLSSAYVGGAALTNHYTHSQQPALGVYYRF